LYTVDYFADLDHLLQQGKNQTWIFGDRY